MIPIPGPDSQFLLELQEGLFYVFGPLLPYLFGFIIGGSILVAALGFVLDVAADLEKS